MQIAFHPHERSLLARIPWPSILLLCGACSPTSD
ncbi:hypothetical protein L829_0001, partial [Mycobacteroides abscessus MAB_030201_1075]